MTDLPLETEITNDLALLQEQVSAIVTTEAPLNAIGEQLGLLYDQAQDDNQRQIISQAWEGAQALATVANNAVALTNSAVVVAVEMRAQRDAIADEMADLSTEHNTLVEAVESADTDHPAVARLYETVTDIVQDQIHDEGFYTECFGCEAHNQGWLGGAGHDEINYTVGAILGFYTGLIPAELEPELAAFVQQFGMKVFRAREAAYENRANATSGNLDEITGEDSEDEGF